MELKYPKSATSIDDMCAIIKYFGIEAKEYTDCAIVYEVTFDQLRTMYNLGKDHAADAETEEAIVRKLDAMAVESLSPEIFEKWQEVFKALCETRKNLKFTAPF